MYIFKSTSGEYRASLQKQVDALRAAVWSTEDIINELEANGRLDPGLARDWKDFHARWGTEIDWPFAHDTGPIFGPSYDKASFDKASEFIRFYEDELRWLRGRVLKTPVRVGPGLSSGVLLPNGTRIGGGVRTGPGGLGGPGFGGGAPSLPGLGGGLLGSLGGNRSGRGPGGSQFIPGVGFFPGGGQGPGVESAVGSEAGSALDFPGHGTVAARRSDPAAGQECSPAVVEVGAVGQAGIPNLARGVAVIE